MTVVHAPNEQYSGVVVGVMFDEGVSGEVELSPAQRAYFRRQGYGLDEPAAAPVEHSADGGPLKVHVGTLLADAAQHGARRVTVLVDGASVFEAMLPAGDVDEFIRDAAETEVAGVSTVEPRGDDGPVEGDEPERPNVRTPKDAWITYAIAQGGDPDEVAEMSKDDLIKRYGAKES